MNEKIPFNSVFYPYSARHKMVRVLEESLNTGHIVTGSVVKEAEVVFSDITKKSEGLGFLIAPYLPLAIALKESIGKVHSIAIAETAWPEQGVFWSRLGFKVHAINCKWQHNTFPSLDLETLDYLVSKKNLTMLFCNSFYGMYLDNMEEVAKYCKENKVLLINDVSYGFLKHSITRTLGDIITMSLNPGKVIPGFNGGLISVKEDFNLNGKDVYDALKKVRLDGATFDKTCVMEAGDWRMLEIQAASFLSMFEHANKEGTVIRLEIAKKYENSIAANKYLQPTNNWEKKQSEYSSLDRFVVGVNNKEDFRSYFNHHGVEIPVLSYDYPFSNHPIFTDQGVQVNGSRYETLAWFNKHCLIPLHLNLSIKNVSKICQLLVNYKR